MKHAPRHTLSTNELWLFRMMAVCFVIEGWAHALTMLANYLEKMK